MRIAVLGNSGSGKSTLAAWLAERSGAPRLDLDTVAWEPGQMAVARAPGAATSDVRAFCGSGQAWIVEGCYADLIGQALSFWPVLLFLNPGKARCLANCRRRPWEPHKYVSRAEQDERLPFLLDWVAEYYVREGPMSLPAHRQVYDGYPGQKLELTDVPDLARPAAELSELVAPRVTGAQHPAEESHGSDQDA